MCPQRRPVQRSRETLTGAPGEWQGGRGRGRTGGRSSGGTGKPRAGLRGREAGRHQCVEIPEAAPGGGRVSGRFLGDHPPTSGVRGPGRGAARAGAWAGRAEWGEGAVFALKAAPAWGGGRAQLKKQCQGGREAGFADGLRAPAAGEGGARPQGIAGVGALIVRGAVPGSGFPCPRTRCPQMRAKPLGQEIEDALMPSARADGCFVSRAGVSLPARSARLDRARGWGRSQCSRACPGELGRRRTVARQTTECVYS